MKIILIRHGATDYNLRRRYCGWTDVGLNKIGRQEAKKIKTKLKRLKINKVFCSDLKRSLQTVRIIFEDTIRIERARSLREINFGKWEGFTYKQILKKFPSLYKKWIRDPFSVGIPNGESTCHFVKRITKKFKKIVKNNPRGTVALVIHSGAMRVILNTMLDVKKNNFWRLKLKSSAAYVIEYKHSLKPKVYQL